LFKSDVNKKYAFPALVLGRIYFFYLIASARIRSNINRNYQIPHVVFSPFFILIFLEKEVKEVNGSDQRRSLSQEAAGDVTEPE